VWTAVRGDTTIPLLTVPSGPSATNSLDLSTVDVQAGDLLTVDVTASDGQLTTDSGPVTVLVKPA
jgi:hypothetical protein